MNEEPSQGRPAAKWAASNWPKEARSAVQDLLRLLKAYQQDGVAECHFYVDHTLTVHPTVPRALLKGLDGAFKPVFHSPSVYLRQLLAKGGLETHLA